MNWSAITRLKVELPDLPETFVWWATGGLPRIGKSRAVGDGGYDVGLYQGFFEGSHSSRKLHDWLEGQGFNVFTPKIYRVGLLNVGDINVYNQRAEPGFMKLVQRARVLGRPNIIPIGYSMGGLTVLYFLQKYHSWIKLAILMATPINGCDLADALGPLVPFMAAKQMQRGSTYLKKLKEGLTQEMLQKVVVIAGARDGIVSPEDAFLPGARDHIVLNTNHFGLYIKTWVYERVIDIIKDSP